MDNAPNPPPKPPLTCTYNITIPYRGTSAYYEGNRLVYIRGNFSRRVVRIMERRRDYHLGDLVGIWVGIV